MSTKNFVPRATGEGGIGTAAKRWATANINSVSASTVSASTYTSPNGSPLYNVVEDTTPQLGGNLDLNGNQIVLVPSPGSDHLASGEIAQMVCGETVAIGNLCYIKSDGKMWLSDADAAATMPAVAIALESGSADQNKNFLFYGFFRDDTYNWTVGNVLFTDTTAGSITSVAPSGTTDVVQAVAMATNEDRIFFNPSLVTLEIV